MEIANDKYICDLETEKGKFFYTTEENNVTNSFYSTKSKPMFQFWLIHITHYTTRTKFSDDFRTGLAKMVNGQLRKNLHRASITRADFANDLHNTGSIGNMSRSDNDFSNATSDSSANRARPGGRFSSEKFSWGIAAAGERCIVGRCGCCCFLVKEVNYGQTASRQGAVVSDRRLRWPPFSYRCWNGKGD